MFACPAFCVGAILAARPSLFRETSLSALLERAALLVPCGAHRDVANRLLRVLPPQGTLSVALAQVPLVRLPVAPCRDPDPELHPGHIVRPGGARRSPRTRRGEGERLLRFTVGSSSGSAS